MLLAVCSVHGSPGVTTLTLALAARWPTGRTSIVVETDVAGGDLAVRCAVPMTPGLVSLAAQARRRSDPDLVLRHTTTLPSGVSALVGPVGAGQTRAALAVVCQGQSVLRRAVELPGVTVILDCGRVGPDSLVLPLLHRADAVVLVARARDDELAHVADALPMVASWTHQPGFVLAGPGHTSAEVTAVLGIPVMGRLPWNPPGAAALYRPGRARHAPSRSALGHSAARVAQQVARRYQSRTLPTSAQKVTAAPADPLVANGVRP